MALLSKVYKSFYLSLCGVRQYTVHMFHESNAAFLRCAVWFQPFGTKEILWCTHPCHTPAIAVTIAGIAVFEIGTNQTAAHLQMCGGCVETLALGGTGTIATELFHLASEQRVVLLHYG